MTNTPPPSPPQVVPTTEMLKHGMRAAKERDVPCSEAELAAIYRAMRAMEPKPVEFHNLAGNQYVHKHEHTRPLTFDDWRAASGFYPKVRGD